MKSESGSNMSSTIVRFIKWRWYRHKDLFISVSLETVRRESECSLRFISVLLLFCNLFASSECAPAISVLHRSGCQLTDADGIAWKGMNFFSYLHCTGGVRRDGFGICRTQAAFGNRHSTGEIQFFQYEALKTLFYVEKGFWKKWIPICSIRARAKAAGRVFYHHSCMLLLSLACLLMSKIFVQN